MPEGHLKRRVCAQGVAVVRVRVAGRDQQHAEADHLGHGVVDPPRGSRILDAAGQALRDPEPALDVRQRQHPGVRGQSASVERDPHRLAGERRTGQDQGTLHHGECRPGGRVGPARLGIDCTRAGEDARSEGRGWTSGLGCAGAAGDRGIGRGRGARSSGGGCGRGCHQTERRLTAMFVAPQGGRRMLRKRRQGLALGRTAAVTAAGLLLAAPFGGSALAGEKLTVRLDFLPWGVHAAMHLAQTKGWFEAAGLEVEVQDGRGSSHTLQLVNARQVDVGLTQLGLLPLARKQGAELTSFAGWLRRTDLCVLVDRGSGLRTIGDLKGKSLVVFAGSPWAPFIDAFLAAGGLDRTNTEVLFVDPAALWGTYTSGRADGMMSTLTSAVPLAEKSRPSDTILLSQAGIT